MASASMPVSSGSIISPQTTRYDEMLTWLLFYTSIFETRRSPAGRCRRSGGLIPEPGHRSADATGLQADDERRGQSKTFAGKFARGSEQASSTSPSGGRYLPRRILRRSRISAASHLLNYMTWKRGSILGCTDAPSLRNTLRPRRQQRRNTSRSTAGHSAKASSSAKSSNGECLRRLWGNELAPFRIAAQRRLSRRRDPTDQADG